MTESLNDDQPFDTERDTSLARDEQVLILQRAVNTHFYEGEITEAQRDALHAFVEAELGEVDVEATREPLQTINGQALARHGEMSDDALNALVRERR